MISREDSGRSLVLSDEIAVAKERASFAWCVKWDPLCPVPKALEELDLTVIEGVLQLFVEYGTVLLPLAGVQWPHDWQQVLGPGLAGVRHRSDPNVMLIPTVSSLGNHHVIPKGRL